MKANELTAGRWILDIFDPKNPKERQIDLDDLAMFKNYANHPLPFKPIPLTEDWLLKLKQSDGLMVKLWKDEDGRYIFGEKWIYPIQHVHQLQNLFFVLTNTELVYEP